MNGSLIISNIWPNKSSSDMFPAQHLLSEILVNIFVPFVYSS